MKPTLRPTSGSGPPSSARNPNPVLNSFLSNPFGSDRYERRRYRAVRVATGQRLNSSGGLIRTGSGSDRPKTQPSPLLRLSNDLYEWLSVRPVATALGSDRAKKR